jgi:formylglycine-generating enzyme required for sulfatase activity
VRLWEVPAKAFTTEHPGSAIHLAYSPDGQTLAVAGADGSLRLWAGGKAQVIATGQTTPATNLAFTADHSIVALAFPGVGVRLFFSAVGEAHSAWEKHAGDSTAVAISADGTRLAIGGRDGAIRLWEVASARLLGEVAPEQQHAGAVRALSFRHDGRQLASGAEDATIKLWNIEGQVPTITATLTGPAGAVTELQYAPGGDLLASGGTEGRARLWNVSGQIGTQPDLYHYLADHWLRFEPDTQRLVWDRGAGWANVPADSIIGLWQSGGGGVFPRLLTVGDWTGAIQALQARPEATRPDARAALASALLADARVAAQSGQWNRLDLRLGQLRQIGAPDAPDLAQRRAAQAAEGGDFTNGDGLEMVWCPPTGPEGFLMGSPETEPGRQECENQHRVRLTSGFWIGRSEVTQGQWVAVMGNNPSVKRADEKGLPRLKAPVENVDWIEAMEYCRRLTDRERTRGAIPPGWEYALPTEAQWEYACRAGTTTAYYFGDDPAEFPKHGNYKDIEIGARVKPVDGFTHTAPIRSYLPNPWKLYDMHGNVSEWSRDTMIMGKDRKKTKYPEGDAVDPLETRGTYRVNRGGGARDTVNNCRAAGRYHNEPTFRIDDLGLRAVLTRIRPASTPGP